MVAIFVVATIIVFLVIDFFVQRAEKRKVAHAAAVPAKARFVIPKGYFFGRGHTWIELLSDNLARVGLDDFAQKIIGRIDDVAFISGGDEVVKGDTLFTLRQGEKELSFRAPISGKVVSFNDELSTSPDVLRKKPYSDGWVAIIKPTNLDKETRFLSRGDEAAQWLKEEIKRFRNFITFQGNTSLDSPAMAGATMLDGGTPVEGVMEHSSKETWQKFENDFLSNNTGK
jgi:glycine cleavage system H lipoate-binding protein